MIKVWNLEKTHRMIAHQDIPERQWLLHWDDWVALEENGAPLVAQMVKNLPTIRETQIWSLGQVDPLDKGMATHSSILAWRIPWTEEPDRLQSMGSQWIPYRCSYLCNEPFSVHFGCNSPTLRVVHSEIFQLSGERSIEVKDIEEKSTPLCVLRYYLITRGHM